MRDPEYKRHCGNVIPPFLHVVYLSISPLKRELALISGRMGKMSQPPAGNISLYGAEYAKPLPDVHIVEVAGVLQTVATTSW